MEVLLQRSPCWEQPIKQARHIAQGLSTAAYLPCALLYLPGRTTVQNPDIVRTDYCVTFLIADVMFAVRDENKQISTTPSFDKMRRTIKAISTRLFLEPVRNFVPG
jgi:hypothetical protein